MPKTELTVGLMNLRGENMKVETSGVIMCGICSVQTDKCLAKEVAPITAVWVPPGRQQLNVCNVCLEEKIRIGEWVVEGAKVKGMRRSFDIAVFNKQNNLVLLVEIKNNIGTSKSWAVTRYDKLLSYNSIPEVPYFILMLPDKAYLWKSDRGHYERNTPVHTFNTYKILEPYLDLSGLELSDISVNNSHDFIDKKREVLQKHYNLQKICSKWLESVTTGSSKKDKLTEPAIVQTGLSESIREGRVQVEAIV